MNERNKCKIRNLLSWWEWESLSPWQIHHKICSRGLHSKIKGWKCQCYMCGKRRGAAGWEGQGKVGGGEDRMWTKPKRIYHLKLLKTVNRWKLRCNCFYFHTRVRRVDDALSWLLALKRFARFGKLNTWKHSKYGGLFPWNSIQDLCLFMVMPVGGGGVGRSHALVNQGTPYDYSISLELYRGYPESFGM